MLWGLLFVLVLTMISGARELMTPGAWKKEGLTYKLTTASVDDSPSIEERINRLNDLRKSLWDYARSHERQFPPNREVSDVPEELWLIPGPARLRYAYIPGLTADEGMSPLVYEPGAFGPRRFVLLTDGSIQRMTDIELHRALPWEEP